MILHLLNKSPSENNALKNAIRFLAPVDAVLLIENGVYAGIDGIEPKLPFSTGNIYALREDVEARGIADKLSADCKLVSYDGFVELTERYPKVQSWY